MHSPSCWRSLRDERGERWQGSSMIRLELSLRGILIVIGILVGLVIVIKLWPVLLLIGTSLMLAAAVMPFVEWLVHRGMSRTAATAIFAVLLLAGFALIGIAVVPAVISQGQLLSEKLPDLRRHLSDL